MNIFCGESMTKGEDIRSHLAQQQCGEAGTGDNFFGSGRPQKAFAADYHFPDVI